MKFRYSISLFFIYFSLGAEHNASYIASPKKLEAEAPRITVVFVVDQFAHHEFQKLYPFFDKQGGFKFIFDNGIRYENAIHPHGMPETATGHTTIGTGTLAKDHGVIANRWYTAEGTQIDYDDDKSGTAQVFAPEGTVYDFGKSPHRIMVDSLSDQLMLNSHPHASNKVFSLALKSRAAIGMAGRLGKALWVDEKSGLFTSSKAYFDKLPEWLTSFNKAKHMNTLQKYTWPLRYTAGSAAYNFAEIDNYKHTDEHQSIIGIPINVDRNVKDPFEYFQKTPLANKYLLDCAQHCIDTHLSTNPHERLVIWVGLSSLDKVGHGFGPHSLEVIDMIYHVDKHIGEFISNLHQKIDPREALFVLTADHGIRPIIEIVQEEGLTLAHRLETGKVIEQANKFIAEKHGINGLVQNFTMPSFYLNTKVLETFDTVMQQRILDDLKGFIRSLPGVAQVWTFDELEKLPLDFNDTSNYLKNQLYRGRSGHLICKIMPYCYIDNRLSATTHGSPYDYDTHVPLVLYQAGKLMDKTIQERVYIPQLAVTLAHILNVPRPSASTYNLLPGITPDIIIGTRAHVSAKKAG